MVKIEPSYSMERTSRVPPWLSQICLQMLRPRPWPLTFNCWLYGSVVRKNGWNMCLISDFKIPIPLSCTDTSSCFPSGEPGFPMIRASIVISYPLMCENLIAFLATLRTTCYNLCLSNFICKFWIDSSLSSNLSCLLSQSERRTSITSRMDCSGKPNSRCRSNFPCSIILLSIKSFE